jgi:hypothetical protein
MNEFFQITKSFWPQYALGFTQPLTEMNTRSRKILFMGRKVWPVFRDDNLASICGPIVYTMWDP